MDRYTSMGKHNAYSVLAELCLSEVGWCQLRRSRLAFRVLVTYHKLGVGQLLGSGRGRSCFGRLRLWQFFAWMNDRLTRKI